MPSKSQVHVRRLEMRDFGFVRDLAAKQANFTIPPPYVLWLLLKIEGHICLIAEDVEAGPVGYALAVPVENPPDSLFIWQLAVSTEGPAHTVVRTLLSELRDCAEPKHIQAIVFSTIADSPIFRAIRRDVLAVFGREPSRMDILPQFVAPNETEYRIDLQ